MAVPITGNNDTYANTHNLNAALDGNNSQTDAARPKATLDETSIKANGSDIHLQYQKDDGSSIAVTIGGIWGRTTPVL
ncbi:MAG: hypothetical protein ACR2P1_15920 [Pseudomonadales bacterium]